MRHRQMLRYCEGKMTDPGQSRRKPGTQIPVKDSRDYILCSNGVCHYRHISRKIKTFLCTPFSHRKILGKHIDIYNYTKYTSTWSPIGNNSSQNESLFVLYYSNNFTYFYVSELLHVNMAFKKDIYVISSSTAHHPTSQLPHIIRFSTHAKL